MVSKYDEIMAGTNIDKNPELPAPTKIIKQGPGDIDSGQIEVPLSEDRPVPPPSIPKVKIKKEITIREADNGYILSVWAGAFKEEWVFNRLSKAIRAIVAFLNTTEE